MAVLRAFLTLLLAQFTGELLGWALHLPLSGPVVGMLLLAAFLLLNGRAPDGPLAATADELLHWLGLLFVPAGVGVVAQLPLLRRSWLPVAAALAISTVLTFAVTACVMSGLQRRGIRLGLRGRLGLRLGGQKG